MRLVLLSSRFICREDISVGCLYDALSAVSEYDVDLLRNSSERPGWSTLPVVSEYGFGSVESLFWTERIVELCFYVPR